MVEQERPRRLIVLDNQDLPLLAHAGLRRPAEFLARKGTLKLIARAPPSPARTPASAGGMHPQFAADRVASATNKVANCGFLFELALVLVGLYAAFG
jgi:hypothetical protein